MQSDHLDGFSAEEVAKFNLNDLIALKGALELDLAAYKDRHAKLQSAFERKFGRPITPGTQTVHRDANGEVKVTVPKIVDWDQEQLNEVRAQLSEMGEDPSEYINTEYKVDENRFKQWPLSLQKMFEAARTVRTGSAKYTFKASE